MRIAPLVVAALFLVGCSKKSSEGLPPASDWSSGSGEVAAKAQPANPHDPSAMNPHDPSAMGGPGPIEDGEAMPPNHPPIGGDQMPPDHPSVPDQGGGPDVTKMGFTAPDPNRPVDPKHHISGTLKVNDKTKANVKAGGAVFLIVKKADANGQPSGPPLAVDKVLYADNLKFTLTEAQAMVAGTELSGDVVVTARYDQDSDAISKQPGDVTGMVKVKIPADNVALTLDTILP